MHGSTNPDVSIIVLNYNGRDHLRDCLDSLIALRFPADRRDILLVDNASTDGSVAWVEEHYPQVKVLGFTTNYGFAEGNNRAAREALGRWVVFLNNDTRVDPDFLEPLLEPLGRDGVVATASRILNFEGDRLLYRGGRGNLFGFGYQKGMGEELEEETDSIPRETLFACGCSMAFDRETFLRWGGFDEDFFAYYEDVDLGWRSWLLGGRTLYVPSSLVYHKGDGSFQHVRSAPKQLLWNRNVLHLVFKNYDEENLRRILPLAVLLTVERAHYFLHQGTESGRAAVLEMFRAAGDEESAEREMHEVGIAHLRALDEFVAALPRFRQKRDQIQRRRTLSDRDLFEKFPLTLELEEQVNALGERGWQDRLMPFFSLEGLVGETPIEDHLFRRLGLLEESVAGYRGAIDSLHEELQRKSRDQEEKGRVIEEMNRHISELERDRAELHRIQSKKWFQAVQKARRLTGR